MFSSSSSQGGDLSKPKMWFRPSKMWKNVAKNLKNVVRVKL
jgi:hypothetical protein